MKLFNLFFTDFGSGDVTEGLGSKTSIKVRAIGAEITLEKAVDFTLMVPAINWFLLKQVERNFLTSLILLVVSWHKRIDYQLETVPARIKVVLSRFLVRFKALLVSRRASLLLSPNQPVNFTA